MILVCLKMGDAPLSGRSTGELWGTPLSVASESDVPSNRETRRAKEQRVGIASSKRSPTIDSIGYDPAWECPSPTVQPIRVSSVSGIRSFRVTEMCVTSSIITCFSIWYLSSAIETIANTGTTANNYDVCCFYCYLPHSTRCIYLYTYIPASFSSYFGLKLGYEIRRVLRCASQSVSKGFISYIQLAISDISHGCFSRVSPTYDFCMHPKCGQWLTGMWQ